MEDLDAQSFFVGAVVVFIIIIAVATAMYLGDLLV